MAFTEKEPFYMVWSAKTGKTRKRHKDVTKAIVEAHRLATAYPGDKFHVLMRVGVCVEPALTTEVSSDNV